MRRRGFTLIELLVVIAIIGILAAMLFPVFARAREAARKVQCLSNVKNIAMAFQMYFTDYDRFPPTEKDANVIQAIADWKGCDVEPFTSGCCPNATLANPYLRWPLILDEYIKNRDVWRCPSAKTPATAAWIIWQPDWLNALLNSNCNCICQVDWPSGWGGTLTDSLTDGTTGTVGAGAFEVDYRANERADADKTMSAVNDPARHFVLAERGIKPDFWGIEQIAYPEICRVMWNSTLNEDCGPNCSDGADAGCGPPDKNETDIAKWINDFWGSPDARKPYTRHMGGNNLGFADGHAKWMPADAMIAAANADPQELEPIGSQDLPE